MREYSIRCKCMTLQQLMLSEGGACKKKKFTHYFLINVRKR